MDRSLFENKLSEVEAIIERYLPEGSEHDKLIIDSVRYSVSAGGKRLRPMIMREAFYLFGGNSSSEEVVHPFMAAMEYIHTYSLVHDDLKCMDNADLRRGIMSTHKKYGEAFGVLAGDALLNLAFETIANAMADVKDHELLKRLVKANCTIARKSGIYGMVGGQALDVQSEKFPYETMITDEMLDYIYKGKTSALIQASLMTGAYLAGASDEEALKMEKAGEHIGLAFQIEDDILDVTGSSFVTGKDSGLDEVNDKKTYVDIKGIEGARKKALEETEAALDLIASLGRKNEFLDELIKQLVDRTY